jgi:hypothetical protein
MAMKAPIKKKPKVGKKTLKKVPVMKARRR